MAIISSTLRNTAILCGTITAIQAVVWLILTLVGFICFFVDTGYGETAVAFHVVYMSFSSVVESPAVVVKPIGFMIIITFYFLISALWLYASASLISAFNKRSSVNAIKQSSKFWMMTTLIICIVDLIVFILFFVDFVQIGKHETVKTRSADLDIMVAKKFSQDFKKLMTKEYLMEAKEILDEFYARKFNITDSPKSEQSGNPFRRNKRTLTSLVVFPIHVGLTMAQTGWNLAEWVISWLPSLPLPAFIRDLIGNPFQPLIDMVHALLFETDFSFLTTPAPGVDRYMKTFNPKMPSAILMGIALRGMLIWLVNCGLLILMFCLLKRLSVGISGIFNCFTDLLGVSKSRRRSRQ